ncbi:MAG: ABC transporter ATP-binding protein/permease [Lachnospiraceae bacterium]|nr:ABC transporter ATP-binding protein/permease [Lachnospiraceae bacterium]
MKMKRKMHYIFRVLNEKKELKSFYILALMIDALVFPLAQIFTSYSEKWLVNAVEFHDRLYMNGVYILSAVVFILIFFVNPLAEYYKEKNVSGMVRGLKDRMADKLLHFPLEYYTNADRGRVLVQMTSDIDGVKSLFSWSLHRFFLAVFYGFGSVALMVCLCWQLSIVMLILAFFEIVCMSKVSVKIQKLSKEIQEGKDGVNNLYSAFIKCLKCIKMLSLHDIMYEKFSRVNTEIMGLQIKRVSRIAGMNVVNDFFSAVNLLGVLFAGIILYFGGYVDLGSVMAFLVVQDGITYMQSLKHI